MNTGNMAPAPLLGGLPNAAAGGLQPTAAAGCHPVARSLVADPHVQTLGWEVVNPPLGFCNWFTPETGEPPGYELSLQLLVQPSSEQVSLCCTLSFPCTPGFCTLA